jgi:hypothetical protein
MKIEYDYVIYDKNFHVLERGKGFESDKTCIQVCEDVLMKSKKGVFSDIREIRTKGKLKTSSITVIATQYKSKQSIVCTNYK